MTSKQAVTDLVPYIHVRDVQRSIDFYAYLGFEPTDVTLDEGVPVWALLVSGSARLMAAQAGEPVDPAAQAVLLYLYTADVAALRDQLAGDGVPVGEIGNPDYMPGGELRVTDPDGYVLLIGQRAGDSDRED